MRIVNKLFIWHIVFFNSLRGFRKVIARCPLLLESLEKLENEPFSEFGWKSWKTMCFSPALAGKAGILFLGPVIIKGIIR